jgi:hypothetical protein
MPYNSKVRDSSAARLCTCVIVLAIGGAACAAETPRLSGSPTPGRAVVRPSRVPVGNDAGPDASTPIVVEHDPNTMPAGPMSPPSLEPLRDPALTIVNGVLDADRIFVCRVGEDMPFPETGLAYGQSNVIAGDSYDLEDASSWVLIAAVGEQPSASCDELIAAAELQRASMTDAGARAPVVNAGTPLSDASATDVELRADAGDPADSGLGARDRPFEAGNDARAMPSVPALAADAGRDSGSGEVRLDAVDVPRLRVVPLATFQAGGLAPELSTLLVAAGCVGGYAEAPNGVCGDAYYRRQSSLTPIVVTLSRQNEYKSLGLQFVNASVVPLATLRSDPMAAVGGSFFTIGSEVGLGEIAPARLRTGIPLASVGEPLEDVELSVEERAGADPLFTTNWQAVLSVSGEPELRDGRGFSFVLLGSPIGDGHQFAGLRLVLVSNDAGRPQQ